MTLRKLIGSQRLLSYWGKALPAEASFPNFHPLVFHSLDVAAVAVAYLDRERGLRRQLASWLGTSEVNATSLIAFLIALHDLGKFADNFQWKRPDQPTANAARTGLPVRSPHARGSTVRQTGQRVVGAAFPARAGINRSRA